MSGKIKSINRNAEIDFRLINRNSELKINNKNTELNKCFRIAVLLVLMLFFIGLFTIPKVLALGVTPGRTTIDFTNEEKMIQFSVLNNEHKNMQVVLTVQGELAGSVTLFDSMLEFQPSEEGKQLKYKVNLPDKLEPGLHTAEITALELPGKSEQGTYIGATVAVITQLYVYVPCPGKCIEADLNILDAEQNSTATFIIPVVNRGKLGIGDARAIIDIYTSLNERIATIETDSQAIDVGGRTELSAKWLANVNQGDYLAKVTVFYDGESKSFEKKFSIGSKLLTIESILVNDFSLGEIAKLRILVENRWSQELKDVFANLLVYNHESQVMADVKSAVDNVPALARKELVAYWDTIGVQEGEYDGKLIVRYGEKSTDKNLLLKISQNSLDITGVGYAIKQRAGGINITTILLILVILLLIVNVAWFVFFKKQTAGKQENKVIRVGQS